MRAGRGCRVHINISSVRQPIFVPISPTDGSERKRSKTDQTSMKRLFIFAVLFPPLALVVFTAPDGFKNLVDWIVMAYAIAIVPALLLAWVDWALSETRLRVVGTAVTAALTSVLIVRFMSGVSDDLWSFLMVGLVGGIPAAVCSWLSDRGVHDRLNRR